MNEIVKTNLNTFNDIGDAYLRAYNRLVVTFNLTSIGKREEASAYLKQFSPADNLAIGVVSSDIQTKGWTVVKKTIQQKLADNDNLIDDYMGDEGVVLNA